MCWVTMMVILQCLLIITQSEFKKKNQENSLMIDKIT